MRPDLVAAGDVAGEFEVGREDEGSHEGFGLAGLHRNAAFMGFHHRRRVGVLSLYTHLLMLLEHLANYLLVLRVLPDSAN